MIKVLGVRYFLAGTLRGNVVRKIELATSKDCCNPEAPANFAYLENRWLRDVCPHSRSADVRLGKKPRSRLLDHYQTGPLLPQPSCTWQDCPRESPPFLPYGSRLLIRTDDSVPERGRYTRRRCMNRNACQRGIRGGSRSLSERDRNIEKRQVSGEWPIIGSMHDRFWNRLRRNHEGLGSGVNASPG